MKVNTTVLVNSGDWLTLSWENVGSPSNLDWIGVYVPTSEGKIDAVNHAPIKFQVSSSHVCFLSVFRVLLASLTSKTTYNV